jgi:PAS domain S-box-containing protein
MNRKLQLEIADRIKAEKSLRDSEQRFRTIFEKARDCIFVKDSELKYSHVNPAMQAVFEASESDVIGSTDEDLYGDDQACRLKSEDLRVLGGQVIEAEHTLTFKGRELTFNCVKVPMMDSSGDIVGLCGIARDVTERLRTRAERRSSELEFKSGSMRKTLNQLRLAAKSDSLVLLLGESGSGKDFLARHVHHLSHRSGGPFFAINCAAVAPELAESELFGHEAGSFTGARARKRGMLELAEGGTLLLNEIGELSLTLQAKLLTFLDTRSFTRVGGEADIEVNARLIAATNRELRKEVEDGRFRHDLFHRLNVFSILVPPLRERLEDLPLLVDTILSQLCAKLGYGEIPRMDARCLPILSEYHWPGNVRELRNVLERAIILSEGGKIKPEGIRFLERQSVSPEHDGWCYVVGFPQGSENLNDVSKAVKSELMKEALRRTSGVKKDAANLLGISVDSFKYQSKSLEA